MTPRNSQQFTGMTPNAFRIFARNRIVMVNIGDVYCKVSKKEFNKAAKGNKISGFTFSDQPGYVWTTYVG